MSTNVDRLARALAARGFAPGVAAALRDRLERSAVDPPGAWCLGEVERLVALRTKVAAIMEANGASAGEATRLAETVLAEIVGVY